MKIIQKNKKLVRWTISLLLLSLFGLILVVTGRWTKSVELDRISAKAGDALNVYTGDLQIELDKFEALPYILSKNPLFLQLLANPLDVNGLDRGNRELERVNLLAETSAIYILDKKGHSIAASNWNEKVSFIGEDLSFRPYFKEAIAGKPGRYFALGNTSNIRGYYYSAPMYAGAEIIGVLTVKVHLQRLEKNWAKGFEKVVVTDPYGVVFISSYNPWRFKTLTPLSKVAQQKLRKSQRYGDIYPDPLGVASLWINTDGLKFISLNPGAIPVQKNKKMSRKARLFLVQSHEMPDAGWTVHILSDISHVDGQVRNITLLVAFLLVSFFLSGALFYNRRRARLKQKKIESESRKALQEVNEQLEHRVDERTRELTRINRHLTSEVNERKRTENQLRSTQEELIQAGKLAAIGQMATSITHEISQPLAAIRMFAENSLILLDEKEPGQVRINLKDIADLVIKMSRITSHLKSFARKSKANLEPVNLKVTVNNVLILLAIEMDKAGVAFNCTMENDLHVLADQVRLEQVLVNILSNAIDAVGGKEDKRIELWAKDFASGVEIIIHDSGSGIAEEYLEHIFEPFFTRKEGGEGLGLGLSLTRSIVKDLGGTIVASNRGEQGAVFTLVLQSPGYEDGEGK